MLVCRGRPGDARNHARLVSGADRVRVRSRLARGVAWRAHHFVRNRVWLHAHRLRRLRSTGGVPAIAGKVVHVTTSFDLGGTQKQIEHLATSPSARYQHAVTEIFPELNYLFRTDVRVDPERYVRGGPVSRAIGREIVDRDRRGWQMVQVGKLVRDFQVERPSIVVGWGHEICVTTFVAAALARVPHIVFCIRTVAPCWGWSDPPFAALLLAAHRRMTPLVDRIAANSTFLQRDHAAWISLDPQRIAVCANGVALAPLPAAEAAEARRGIRQCHGIPDDAMVICNVGRFSAEKGQLSLLDANRALCARTRRPVVWLLCGDGATLDEARAAAAAQSMTNVIFAGRTSAVREMLAASDVFVMPSDYEGMPNAMMEAMVAGLPCVSTSRSGITDVARDGIEAMYYEPGDTALLVEHLYNLAENPSRAQAMGLAARSRIGEFDVVRQVGCFEAILDGLASPSP